LRRAVTQFSQLERRTSAGGKDTVNHPSGGHDDVSNAIAGLVQLAQDGGSKEMKISDAAIATISQMGQPGFGWDAPVRAVDQMPIDAGQRFDSYRKTDVW
jgi:hypothetical protein